MKKLIKKLSFASLATIGAISVASCSNKDESYVVSHQNVEAQNASVTTGGERKSYSNASYTDRTEILGLLEKYAVNNNLTGLTLYGDGSYAAYSDRLTSPNGWNYVSGYGFGIISEGSITSDMASENNAAWKRYYHTYETDKPSTLNYMNDQTSVVGDLQAYISGALVGSKLDEENNEAYRWMGDLVDDSTEGFDKLITAVDANSEGMATEFKFKVKTSDVKYTLLSSNATLSKYNNKTVSTDDYLTPYKLYYSQYIGFARSTETFNTSQEVVGAQAYYQATKDAKTWDEMDAAWNQYMSKSIFIDNEGYLHIKYKQSQNLFYGMYYSSSFMFAPCPKSFLTDLQTVGSFDTVADAAKNAWMASTDNTHGSLTPVDTALSTGAYAVESWTDTAIVFKRSNRDDLPEGMYNIAGLHFKILTAAKTDSEAAWKEFQNGSLDAAGVPSTQLEEHRNDSNVHVSTDSSTYKINYNACTKEMWESLFGTDGSITQTSESDYWDVKPIMSNNDFLKGLSLALDRRTFAETFGRTATANFFGNAYMSNPETGEIYNTTEAHAAAVADLINDSTDAYGYSLTLAQERFTAAAKTLTEAGTYKSGDKISIEIAWQTQSQSETQGAALKKMFENAFNDSEANKKYGLTLEITNYACSVWSDVYYKKMMVGQFDLAFGSISGNSLNPLNFLEVLKSDNSSGFTLNWGTDTNTVSNDLYYDGQNWSYDALWTAADSSALVKDGKKMNYVDTALESSTYNEDGTRTTKIKFAAYSGDKYRATFTNEDGSVKDGYVSVSLYDHEGNEYSVTSSDYSVKVEGEYIVITTNANVEVDSCLMAVQIVFDVEEKGADGAWTAIEEQKSETCNGMSFTTGE